MLKRKPWNSPNFYAKLVRIVSVGHGGCRVDNIQLRHVVEVTLRVTVIYSTVTFVVLVILAPPSASPR